MTSSSASARHVIRGVVRDYNKHVVAGAHVSASFDGQYVETRTDARGAFSVEAPRGAFVSATAGDMLGHVTVDGDTIEIVMTQLPM